MHDAIVVGGGVSGIAAAVQLHAAGADVLLLEARGRLGGRVATAAVGGVAVERGGEFLDAAPDGALLPLLEQLGVATAPASQDGAGHRTGTLGVGLVDVGGMRRHGRDLPAAVVDPIAALERDLDDLAARIDAFAPWELDGAGALDATSLADRLAEHGADRDGLAVAEALLGIGGSTVPITEMSLLAMAAKQVHRGPHDGRLSLRFAGGAMSLDAAARRALGDRVQLHAPVTALRATGDGVEVETRAGVQLHARTAIVALPVPAWRALAVRPLLDPARLEALATVRMGHVVKAHVTFDEPWWRERADAPLPAATDTACGHVYEARVTAEGATLACFAGAAAAHGLYRLAPAARPGAVLRALEDLLGRFPERPRAVRLDAWNEAPWTGGSYLVYRTGELTRFRDALARPAGRIVPAGAEASSMPSYIGGAAEAGARAAAAALAVVA